MVNASVRQALRSVLFRRLAAGELLLDGDEGGCVLFEKKEQVEALLREDNAAL